MGDLMGGLMIYVLCFAMIGSGFIATCVVIYLFWKWLTKPGSGGGGDNAMDDETRAWVQEEKWRDQDRDRLRGK